MQSGRQFFYQLHVSYVVVEYWGVRDAPISQTMDPTQVTPTVVDLVKNEIIVLVICMYILLTEMLQYVTARRIRRIRKKRIPRSKGLVPFEEVYCGGCPR